jgi:hypothetical protein
VQAELALTRPCRHYANKKGRNACQNQLNFEKVQAELA